MVAKKKTEKSAERKLIELALQALELTIMPMRRTVELNWRRSLDERYNIYTGALEQMRDYLRTEKMPDAEDND